MKNIFLIFILSLLASAPAFGRITLNVGIVYKKGIDKGLILVSELHSIKEFFGTEEKTFVMKNGIRVQLKAFFFDRSKDYGPSSTIRVLGKIFNSEGRLIRDFKSGEVDIPLGESRTVIHQDVESQIIELILEPHIQ
jgi:hypothetical protein